MARVRAHIPHPARQLVDHFSDPLYRTTYLLAAGSGITAILGLGFWILAAKSYSPHVVGVNSAVISAMLFLANICQLGLPNVLLRDLPTAAHRARSLVGRSYGVMFTVSLVVGIGGALSAQAWSSSLGFLSRDTGWVLGFGLATAMYAIFQGQDSVLAALGAAAWIPLENSIFSVAKLLLLLGLFSLSPLAGPFIAWSAPAAGMALLITVLIFRRLLGRRSVRGTGPDFDSRRFIRMAAANQVALVLSYVVTLLMPVIVAAATSPTTTAYFYVPWTIASGVVLLAVNTATSLTVQAGRTPQELARLTRRALVHGMRLVVPLSLIVIFLAPVLLRLYGVRYAANGGDLLRLLIIGAIPNLVYTVGEALLRIQHRPALLIGTQGGQCVLFLALSILLLNRHGIYGIGESYLISQILGAGVVYVVAIRGQLRPEPAPAG
jgi:O-antigen/teichoic acid export membrane protein